MNKYEWQQKERNRNLYCSYTAPRVLHRRAFGSLSSHFMILLWWFDANESILWPILYSAINSGDLCLNWTRTKSIMIYFVQIKHWQHYTHRPIYSTISQISGVFWWGSNCLGCNDWFSPVGEFWRAVLQWGNTPL